MDCVFENVSKETNFEENHQFPTEIPEIAPSHGNFLQLYQYGNSSAELLQGEMNSFTSLQDEDTSVCLAENDMDSLHSKSNKESNSDYDPFAEESYSECDDSVAITSLKPKRRKVTKYQERKGSICSLSKKRKIRSSQEKHVEKERRRDSWRQGQMKKKVITMVKDLYSIEESYRGQCSRALGSSLTESLEVEGNQWREAVYRIRDSLGNISVNEALVSRLLKEDIAELIESFKNNQDLGNLVFVKYACGLCKKFTHNRRTCPLNANHGGKCAQ